MEAVMIISYKSNDMDFQDHPTFKGVKIAKLVGKKDGSPVGISILKIEKGVEIPIHIHEDSIDSIYCLHGHGEIFEGSAWRPLNKGDYFFVPKGERHGVKNTGNGTLKLFICHSPPLF